MLLFLFFLGSAKLLHSPPTNSVHYSIHPFGPLQTIILGQLGDLAILQSYTYDFCLRKLYDSMQNVGVSESFFLQRISSEYNLSLHL